MCDYEFEEGQCPHCQEEALASHDCQTCWGNGCYEDDSWDDGMPGETISCRECEGYGNYWWCRSCGKTVDRTQVPEEPDWYNN